MCNVKGDLDRCVEQETDSQCFYRVEKTLGDFTPVVVLHSQQKNMYLSAGNVDKG